MRGRREHQVSMLAIIDLETWVPANHPLRTIKSLADRALAQLSPEFHRMYAQVGRPSIPPERLLKASLLISLPRCAANGVSASNWIATSSSAGFWA